ncbi:MAG: baseplate J/gp47 family protein [Planctomycetota bacterium]
MGTFAEFRAAMLRAAGQKTPLRDWTGRAPLAAWNADGLQTPAFFARERGDHGLALIEMWAYLAEILSFYQERAINEAFLGTARQRENLERLAGLVGHRPSPGASARAAVALLAEPGASVTIPRGLQIQSVPAQGQRPQKFEADEAIEARGEWNERRIFAAPELSTLQDERHFHVLAEVARRYLTPGSQLLFAYEGAVEMKRVVAVDVRGATARVRFDPPVPKNQLSSPKAIYRWSRQMDVFGRKAPERYLKASTDGDGRTTFSEVGTDSKRDWAKVVALDRIYDGLSLGSKLVLFGGVAPVIHTVTGTNVQVATFGLLSALTTHVMLKAETGVLDRVGASVLFLEQELVFWSYPPLVKGNTACFEAEPGFQMEAGRLVLLGDDLDAFEARVEECRPLDNSRDDFGLDLFKLVFSPGLDEPGGPGSLDGASARFYGNVVHVSHGESVRDEVLGDGRAAEEFQEFRLKKAPLTHLPDRAADDGVRPELEVRVDGVVWRQAPTLHGQRADARVLARHQDPEGMTVLRAGDGRTGGRLTSGRKNVVATYRVGLGRVGRVGAGAIRNLLTRPKGLKAAFNPAPAYGGADPDGPEATRARVPGKVRTLGRIVSLRDFEDAALEFPWIAKARASWRWSGARRAVELIVAGDGGAPLGAALGDLRAAFEARRDTNRSLTVREFVPVYLSAVIDLAVHEDHAPSTVVEAVRSALLERFSYERALLGAPVHRSDFYLVVHGVPGVVAARVALGDERPGPEHVVLEPDQLALVVTPTDFVITTELKVRP